MQGYAQQGQQYQRPGSAASFAGQQTAPPVPPYGGGYQSAAPQSQSQWSAPPPPNQAPAQQWNQPQQMQGGYNPGTYGHYPTPQHDQPPPPPPKPYGGFAAAVQQQQQQQLQQPQAWPQQQQHNASQAPQQQGGYPVQGGIQNQQQYNSAAPPPPSATPGGSYFPPAQAAPPVPPYGAQQPVSYSSTPSATPQTSTVMSPNEQQPAYIPPSLTGQGVQAYMPSNTNPMPGVYVPPPPDVPAWQQAQHAPLQGGKKFRYTKPNFDPNLYAQGYQAQSQQPQYPPTTSAQYGQAPAVSQHPQQPPGPPPPAQYTPQGHMPPQPSQDQAQTQQGYQGPYIQQSQGQYHQQPYAPSGQSLPAGQYPQPPSDTPVYNPDEGRVGASNMSKPYNDYATQAPFPLPSNVSKPYHDYGMGQGASNMSKPHNDYATQVPMMTGGSNMAKPYNDHAVQGNFPQASNMSKPHNDYAKQAPLPHPASGETHQAPSAFGSLEGQQTQDVEGPKPLARTDTVSSNFYNQPSPQSQPVSPVTARHSSSFASGQPPHPARTGSISSIALANLHAQREGSRTSSPKPPPKLPTPPPPRDDKSKFSALGTGGPSDWEHFGDDEIDDEEMYARKPAAAQLDSVELPASHPELPAHNSPPSTQGWPSPISQPTVPNAGNRSNTLYQPTPPPVIAQLADQHAPQASQQQFVMGDAAPAPLSISPKPLQGGSRGGGEGWATPKLGTPSQSQSQHQPPPAQQAFVMGDSQLPTLSTDPVTADSSWSANQQTPTQERRGWMSQQTQQPAADAKAKEEAMERQRAEFEQERACLHAELEQLRGEVDLAKKSAANEKALLDKELETAKAASVEMKSSTLATTKENQLTIERMKEDIEGKESNIKERDDLVAELRQQLEAEKSKEPLKPTLTPRDLVPDLDPWYAGSLERFIAMLRKEENEPVVEIKIKTFTAFIKAESEIRGIPFFSAPPTRAVTPVATAGNTSGPSDTIRSAASAPQTSITSKVPEQKDLSVQVPPTRVESPDDEEEYSPGGRPLLTRKATIPLVENKDSQRQADTSAPATTILTPTSSVDGHTNRTPMQSPPEEISQPVYMAYTPPALFSRDSSQPTRGRIGSEVSAHGPSTSSNSKPLDLRPRLQSNASQPHDEIFFANTGPNASKPTSRPRTGDSEVRNLSPAALAVGSNRSASVASSHVDATEFLASLLLSSVEPATSNHATEELEKKLKPFQDDMIDSDKLTKDWEKTAAVIRKKLDSARRARQEENEEDNNDAFDNNEISYADLNALEDEFKQKENSLKAQEDRDEYKSYVEDVFDKVYDSLQEDIKALMDLYIDAENLLHTSVSGAKSLDPSNHAPSTQSALELLHEVHKCILARHDAVVAAVAERDKRYRKTETAPLYAAGNITKLKAVEAHFDNAEKQALVRALRDKAGRVGELVKMVEDVVVDAVGVEQREIDAIVSGINDIEDGTADAELLSRAEASISYLKTASTAHLRIFNTIEFAHNAAVLDAEIAQAKAEGADAARLALLEEEKAKGEKKFMDEFKRRVEVIEGDAGEMEELVKKKVKRDAEEVEREKRLKAALEEAKRRNGEV